MKIIPEALPLAKLQRTDMSVESIIASYELDYRDVAELSGDKLRKLYSGKMLDIGCGIAGWECYLGAINSSTEIYLIDKTQIDKEIYYGYNPQTAFYNSLEIAKKNLIANGIKEEKIYTQEATEDNKIKFHVKFDLIVSFISCGFHYPVETYLDQIYEKLNKGGVLIIDLRKGTDGLKKCLDKFQNHEVIREEAKYKRVMFTK